MATAPITNAPARTAEAAERRFYLLMAIAMSVVIVSGFAFHLAMGRSTFDVPLVFHIHAFVFFGWTGLFLAQNIVIAGNNAALHRRLGMLAFAWVPAMVAAGMALSFTVARRTGGPFFFDVNQFLFSNPAHLLAFAAITLAAMKARRYSGWHRRLMLVGFSILTGPGLGRLLPLPLMMPHAWHIMIGVLLIWPLMGMVRDLRTTGRVHPAWFWGIGILLGFQLVADFIAYSDFGIALTERYIAGSPGAERPMHAFVPPGFNM